MAGTVEGPSRVPTQWKVASPVPVGWMRQFRYMTRLYDRIRDVPGEVVECGLGEGNTFAMLAHLIGSEGHTPPQRTLWGFDSFEGWPEPTLWDASPRNPQKGEWAVREAMVTIRFEESGIYREFPALKIQIVKGFLAESLKNFPPERPIAFLHLDVDLYPGYRDGLEQLFPLVADGGLVLFDEYREYPIAPEYDHGRIEKWPGCSRAVDEYFARHPQVMHYDPDTKKYYIIKNKF